MLEIINYTPDLKGHVKTLNVEWLTKYFTVEPHDEVVLSDPQTHILDKGGRIFFAVLDGQVVGTVSLIRESDERFELSKMAVTETIQGKGIGKALLEHAIQEAKKMGVVYLFLLSNTKLTPALTLYRNFGFEEVPLGSSVYVRADIKMELYVGNSALYESEDRVEKAFDSDALPEEQQQAQWAELVELKKAINDIYQRKQAPISILDIGVGSARVVRRLQGIPEVWAQIQSYDGIDNAQACVDISSKVVAELGIGDKVEVHFFDVQNISQWTRKYDLIMTTWFTGGNFYPVNFPFETYNPAKERLDLSKNEAFNHVFSHAYQLLNPGGEIILGAVYVDQPATRKRQEAFYHKLNMTVITDEKDSFTATRERFWSQRFTPERIRGYFQFAPQEHIEVIPLDTYGFAMQVRVRSGA